MTRKFHVGDIVVVRVIPTGKSLCTACNGVTVTGTIVSEQAEKWYRVEFDERDCNLTIGHTRVTSCIFPEQELELLCRRVEWRPNEIYLEDEFFK